MKFKNQLFVFILALLLPISLFAQNEGTVRVDTNQQFAGDRQLQFGDFPDATLNAASSKLKLNVRTGQSFDFEINGTAEFNLNATTADFKNNDITTTGKITAPFNGTVGATTPAAGAFTTVAASSTITSTAATNIGWSIVAGANTACNTTCTNACVAGQDTDGATKPLVDCASAIADLCICAGAN